MQNANFPMKITKLLTNHETAPPLLAMAFASAVTVALIATRVLMTRNLEYAAFIWNLFLAWLPLVFAVLARDCSARGGGRTWRFYSLAGAWLLFFPNAPYIFTDLVHLQFDFFRHYWVDLTTILLCAFTGMMLGFVSLYLMHSVIAKRFGRAIGWFFVALTAGLSSFGIYLGRFLRLNSWDVLLRPGTMYHRLDYWMDNPMLNRPSAEFLVVFTVFVFLAYVMLYALTHLPKLELTHDQPETISATGEPA
jgi:uncharacterized membrane protein